MLLIAFLIAGHADHNRERHGSKQGKPVTARREGAYLIGNGPLNIAL
jgi:hypothetical protein